MKDLWESAVGFSYHTTTRDNRSLPYLLWGGCALVVVVVVVAVVVDDDDDVGMRN